ncbi:hypothetical protein ACFLWU_03420 [Chloroflexota bacterium]
MDIHIPRYLKYLETKQFIGQYFQQSMTSEDSEWNFDWTGVEWIDLPEAISILNWSTKLDTALISVKVTDTIHRLPKEYVANILKL